MNEDIIYFSVNNWFCGEDYPPTENFKKWLGNDLKQAFRSDEWAKENKLCIYCGVIDMSINYTIAAPREWVEKNCPELLTDDEFTYRTYIHSRGEIEHKKKYSDFVDKPDEYGEVEDRFGWPYLEYKPENFGVHWYHDPNEYCDDNEDEDEEEDETLEEQPEEKEEEKSVNQEEEIDDEEDDDFSLFGWLTNLFKIKR